MFLLACSLLWVTIALSPATCPISAGSSWNLPISWMAAEIRDMFEVFIPRTQRAYRPWAQGRDCWNDWNSRVLAASGP